MNFTLNQEQYEALVAFAQRGASTPQQKRELDSYLAVLEKANGVTRYKLWVQWQEADSSLPPTTQFPEVWPPEMRAYIEFLSRPIARSDVEQILVLRARKPVTVLVTPDPAALVGWTTLDAFFVR